MEFENYVANISFDETHLLKDWKWLLENRFSLWFVTKFGDAFLKEISTQAIFWLNVVQGQITESALDEAEFRRLASIPENRDTWFMPAIVDGQAMLQMQPSENQCLSFKILPILGGQLEPDNIEVTDIMVHFSIAGQIFRQVKDLPPGTKITELKIEGMPNSNDHQNKPWWRRW